MGEQEKGVGGLPGWRRRLTVSRFTCPDSAAKRAKPLQNQRFRQLNKGSRHRPIADPGVTLLEASRSEITAWCRAGQNWRYLTSDHDTPSGCAEDCLLRVHTAPGCSECPDWCKPYHETTKKGLSGGSRRYLTKLLPREVGSRLEVLVVVVPFHFNSTHSLFKALFQFFCAGHIN